MSFLRPLESFIGMFQCLFGMFVSSLVIFFPVVRRGSTVRVCGEFVVLGSSSVRVIWHSVSHPRGTTPSWNDPIFQTVQY
jgi:hypothetical protein